MEEWFKDWFNTKEYLNVYRHRNEEDAKELVELILENIDIPLNGKVLGMDQNARRDNPWQDLT